MIKIENLCKTFRTTEVETIALNNVSFEIADIVAIMGPSGCGKSTLLNIMGLLDNPTSGDYYLDTKEVGHLKEKDRTNVRKGNIGFVFQSFNLIDELNVARRTERGRERRASPHLLGRTCCRTETARSGHPETDEHQPPCETLSATALRRSAATCGNRPRRGVEPQNHPCRRADR